MKPEFQRIKPGTQNILTAAGLFLLALLPRIYSLQQFVTADEAKWVYRSAQFLAAFLRGDFAATSVNLTPAVTTTWLGSMGLALYYQAHRSVVGMPFTGWLLSLPQFRTELDILAATRWPVAIFTALGVVAIYLLARRLFNPLTAFVGAAFIALDPHTVALSRILGHDAPAAVLMSLSVLLLLVAVKPSGSPRPGTGFRQILPLVLSGAAAGLAFLSKAPAFFLVPFTGLVCLSRVWGRSTTLVFWARQFIWWAAAAYLTFVVFWPAAWVAPVDRPAAVVENAFLSATDQEEAGAEGYWLVPDLGPFYYVVNTAFKLSPLVMVGAGIAVIFLFRGRVLARDQARPGLWLLVYALLFAAFMTLGEKRSARYILPAFPPLALVAAAGWEWLYRSAASRWAARRPTNPAARPGPVMYALILTLCALAVLLPYAPYYFTFFNPLVGGPFTAPRWVKIGWGEGLDRVGRFLQSQDVAKNSRVGTAYSSTVAPFFQGDLSDVDGPNLDYVVLYTKQVQSGKPLPAFIRYYQTQEPVFSVNLNGIHYADIYPGPALQESLALTPGLDHAILPKPLGFRPLTPYGHIGETMTVDVVWLANDPLPGEPSLVTLEPLSAFDFLSEHNHPNGTPEIPRQKTVLAGGAGRLTRQAGNLVVSRHRLTLPDDLPRGGYALLVDGRPLGEVELRRFRVPAGMAPAHGLVFENQIDLAGFKFEPSEDYVAVTVAWQARQARLPDYTVFAQLLNADTNERVAGIDTRPQKGEWPTSRWAKGEVVVDTYLVAVPYGLPAGYYKIIVGFYQADTGRRLVLPDSRDYWLVPWTYIRK